MENQGEQKQKQKIGIQWYIQTVFFVFDKNNQIYYNKIDNKNNNQTETENLSCHVMRLFVSLMIAHNQFHVKKNSK